MNLESYILKNRSELDIEKPDEDYLWTGISHAMTRPKRSRQIILWYSVAAAFTLIIMSLTFTYILNNRTKQQLIFVNIDPTLAKQEAQFQNQINAYSKLIRQTSFDDNQLASGSSEIQYIDNLINHYSEDLKQNGPNSMLIYSLMDLYRKKIMLLERMLNEIEKSKDHEKHKTNI